MYIRKLEFSDLSALLELYAFLHETDDALPEQAVIEEVWHEIMSSSSFSYFCVFEVNRLLASCTISVIPNLTRACRPYGLIENVVTHADFRKRGFGRALLKHCLAFAWREGCYKVMLLSGRKDEATFSFYENAGFNRHEKQAFIARSNS